MDAEPDEPGEHRGSALVAAPGTPVGAVVEIIRIASAHLPFPAHAPGCGRAAQDASLGLAKG